MGVSAAFRVCGIDGGCQTQCFEILEILLQSNANNEIFQLKMVLYSPEFPDNDPCCETFAPIQTTSYTSSLYRNGRRRSGGELADSGARHLFLNRESYDYY